MQRRLHLATALVAALAVLPARANHATAAAPLPAELDRYLNTHVKLDAQQRSQLLAGSPITKLLESDASKEVAIFGAVWVNALVERYLAAVKDIEHFESGPAFRVTKKVSSPPRLEDFAQLSLPEDDIADLKSCRVAKCLLKLSEATIEQMRRTVDWSGRDVSEQVNRFARQMSLQYVNGYLEGGNERLAVYRDSERPTFVAKEFEGLVERLPELGEFVPRVRRYLLDFPKATLPGVVDSFVYWQDANFGLKRTIRISHLVIAQDPEGAIVATKMLYASHYFWTALELRALVRDAARGGGFWFVTESHCRSDGLTGFTGRFVRSKVRGEAQKNTIVLLQLTKKQLETK